MLLCRVGATVAHISSPARTGVIQARQLVRRVGCPGLLGTSRSDECASAEWRLVGATIAPSVTTRLSGDSRSLASGAVPKVRTPDDFYAAVETAIPALDERLRVFVDEYRLHRAATGRPLGVLDVGCGRFTLLRGEINSGDDYFACDFVEPDNPPSNFRRLDLNEESVRDAFAGEKFDVVFCGEVIEHLFSPDALLSDLRDLLRPGGILILSTPNLAYWVNRFLLLIGISPLFVENSSRHKLGRRFRFLGQGNPTQGHIRLFTYRAARELLDLHGFELLRTRPVRVWRFPVDRLICRLSKSLAPDNVYVARRL
jgi:SAM-dependent methyltransferase